MSALASTPAYPLVTNSTSLALTRRNLERLRKALRREKARARIMHWTYDLSRQLALEESVRRHEAVIADAIAADLSLEVAA
ncbi:hypothetical protein L1787_12900 [Acuticoccus sp. M5D2P5]|uniref:hypothetical protein n=1 Tax=Acuticoccus kalidii TaxID=2910977 RepID=UPI001F1AF4F7|nr:hypothetical protein [Acuticoccus kalidii]MCF3934307.1 hypothetical protein [Acuticoccus kalidii]